MQVIGTTRDRHASLVLKPELRTKTMQGDFQLHARLSADTLHVTDWPLSQILLMNDVRYWWLILVPRRSGLSEIHDLPESDQHALIGEIARASAGLKRLSGADKINVGALGNLVPQLHVHVVARFTGDPAWPGPVWGHSKAEAYPTSSANARIASLRAHL
jgi:diadenosine tetraphosphate (Ap4A) HIT family hydrolase